MTAAGTAAAVGDAGAAAAGTAAPGAAPGAGAARDRFTRGFLSFFGTTSRQREFVLLVVWSYTLQSLRSNQTLHAASTKVVLE